MSLRGLRALAAVAAAAACLAGWPAPPLPPRRRRGRCATAMSPAFATACSAAPSSGRWPPGRPSAARSTSTTSSCRRWRAGSFPTRCSSSPAVPGRARSRWPTGDGAVRAGSTTGATSSSSTSAAPAARRRWPARTRRTRPLAEQAEPERQRALLAQCKAALRKLPWLQAESDLRLLHDDDRGPGSRRGAARARRRAHRPVGGSYGTRVALELLRQFPATVRRIVLDGVAPADMACRRAISTDNQAALDAPARRPARREPACARGPPQLRARWRRCCGLPREATGPSADRRDETLHADARAGARRDARALYAPALAAALPEAIDAAAARRLRGPDRPERDRARARPRGWPWACTCRWSAPRTCRAWPPPTDKPGSEFGTDFAGSTRRSAPTGRAARSRRSSTTLPPSRSPALVLSGGLDPATPPRHGERVAAALGPLARHVVVPTPATA